MDDHYAELEIAIFSQGNNDFAIDLRYSPAGSDADIRPLVEGARPLRLDLEQLRELALDPDAYGRLLGASLLADPQARLGFEQALANAHGAGARLRVRLYISAASLHGLRWEALCHPESGARLSVDEGLTVSRYLSSLDWSPVVPQPRGELRALIAVAAPQNLADFGLAPINAQDEIDRARLALGDIPADVMPAGGVSLAALGASLREGYALLYLVAHGGIRDGQPFLWLDGERGGAAHVMGATLATRLAQQRRRPHLAVLASCASAGDEAGSSEPPVALGPQLVRAGVPAVVAFQGPISLTTAGLLLPTFFRELRQDGQVDRALTVARAAVQDASDWWAPVLFLRLRSGRLWLDPAAPAHPGSALLSGLDRLSLLARERTEQLEPRVGELRKQLQPLLETPEAALSLDQQHLRTELLGEAERLSGAITGLSLAELAQGAAPAHFDPRCPFRGLAAFGPEDAEFFFGRESLVDDIRRRLSEHPFIAILGSSGSGKSSLVLAGLLRAPRDSEFDLVPLIMRPGSDPEVALDAALDAQAKRKPDHSPLVVDQFEEVFTLCSDERRRERFFDRLLALTQDRRVIITMRADFIGECARYDDLRQAIQNNLQLVAPLGTDALLKVIQRQAEVTGLRFEPELLGALMSDVRGEPGAMPLLQHVLRQLWLHRFGRWLRLDEYKTLGGIAQAVASTADRIYAAFGEEQQRLMRILLTRLTHVDDEATVEGVQRDSRSRVPRAELLALSDPPAAMGRLIEDLATARLLVISDGLVEVVHEALIRFWPRLRDWLNEDRTALRLLENVRRAALEWEAQGRDESFLLHRGRRYDQVEPLSSHRWLRLTPLQRDYLEACLAAEQRARQVTVFFTASVDRRSLVGGQQQFALRLMFHAKPEEDLPRWRRRSWYRGDVADIPVVFDLGALHALEGDAEAYGQLLGTTIFANEDLRRLVAYVRPAPRTSPSPFSINLQIGVPALEGLAWETLRDPDDGTAAFTTMRVARSFPNLSPQLRAFHHGWRHITLKPVALLELDIRATGADVDSLLLQAWPTLRGREKDSTSLQQLIAALSQLATLKHLPRLVILAASAESGLRPAAERAALLADAQHVLQVGVPAVLLLPSIVDTQVYAQVLDDFIDALSRGASIDIALQKLRSDLPPPLRAAPILCYAGTSRDLGYIAGFAPDQASVRWSALLASARRGDVIPILGPDVAEAYLGSFSTLARHLAELHGISVADPDDLFLVTRALMLQHSREVMLNELFGMIEDLVRRRCGMQASPAKSLAQLFAAVNAERRLDEREDLYALLAELPLPIYVTTTYDPLLREALRAAGRSPSICSYPWIEKEQPEQAEWPEPSVEKPMVFHLWGTFQDKELLVVSEDDWAQAFSFGDRFSKLAPRPIRDALTRKDLLVLGFDQTSERLRQQLQFLLSATSGRTWPWTANHIFQSEWLSDDAHRDQLEEELTYRYEERYGTRMSIYWGSPVDFTRDLRARLAEADAEG